MTLTPFVLAAALAASKESVYLGLWGMPRALVGIVATANLLAPQADAAARSAAAPATTRSIR